MRHGLMHFHRPLDFVPPQTHLPVMRQVVMSSIGAVLLLPDESRQMKTVALGFIDPRHIFMRIIYVEVARWIRACW